MIRWHESLSSTMDAAHQLAKNGAPHGEGVAAREQRTGRGRRGHLWHASRGGLWLSVICRPEVPVGGECLSLRAGMALALVVESVVPGIHLMIKWPNDLLLRGRKVAGILCEARWSGPRLDWIVVGVGLNITNQLSCDLTSSAICLREVIATPPGADLFAPLVARVIAQVSMIAGPLTAEEITGFNLRDALRGRVLVQPVAGTATGIADSGALVIVDSDEVSHQVVGGGAVVSS